MYYYLTGFIFHRFLDNTNKWIWRTLEFRRKILEFRIKFLEFRRQILQFYGEIYALKLPILEFRFKICLSLEKILSLEKKS